MGTLLVCPECAHEWVATDAPATSEDAASDGVVSDAVGNVLTDGDSVNVIKNLKVKGNPTA